MAMYQRNHRASVARLARSSRSRRFQVLHGTAHLSQPSSLRFSSATVNECQLPTAAVRAPNVAFVGGSCSRAAVTGSGNCRPPLLAIRDARSEYECMTSSAQFGPRITDLSAALVPRADQRNFSEIAAKHISLRFGMTSIPAGARDASEKLAPTFTRLPMSSRNSAELRFDFARQA